MVSAVITSADLCRRYSAICCNLSVHVFINSIPMATEVAVSRLEVAQRVTLPSTNAHSCIHLSFPLSVSVSIHLFLEPAASLSSTHNPHPIPVTHPSELPGKKSWHPYPRRQTQPKQFSLCLLLTHQLDFVCNEIQKDV